MLAYGIPPEFRDGAHLFILNRHTPSGQFRVYRVTRLRTDGVHCRESAGTELYPPSRSAISLYRIRATVPLGTPIVYLSTILPHRITQLLQHYILIPSERFREHGGRINTAIELQFEVRYSLVHGLDNL